MRIVIKIGGALFAQGVGSIIADIKENMIEHQIIIVHGGGPQITALGKEREKEAKYFDTPTGMRTRYTDADQMENVKMALAGAVNKSLVQQMQKVGIPAFGFTGLDGGSVRAKRKDKIMVINSKGKRQILYGEFSGKVESVDAKPIQLLLDAGYVPVIGSMSLSEDGEAVNVDGDRVAAAVAATLQADKYFSMTDVPGIYRNFETKDLIPRMSDVEAESFMNSSAVSGGMKKKIFAALEAIKGGVKEFVIYSGQETHPLGDVLKENKGTTIFKA